MNDLQRMLKDIEIESRSTQGHTGKGALDPRIMVAMQQVPRHEFVSPELRASAYNNTSVPIGSGQTISQPYIVALMSDLLNTKATDRILEIGTGSGYQAAVLSQLVQQVYSIEIIKDLTISAGARLKQLAYKHMHLRTGDGSLGWPEQAPFDGIIVTAATLYIPKPWIEQLKAGARMVVPIGIPHSDQELMVVEKKANGDIETHAILKVSFVPLTGNAVNC